MTTTGYSGQQVNFNYPFGDRNGMLINITGADIPELYQNLEQFIEHVAVRLPDLRKSVEAATVVGEAFPGTTNVGSPAQSVSAPLAQAAPTAGPSIESDRWGNTFEVGRPDAPLTPFGPAVLKRGKSQAGNAYTQWIDPRSKAVPSNYAKGIRQDPADKWEAQFAARGI